jgi:Protein of unknown function (DUF1203)
MEEQVTGFRTIPIDQKICDQVRSTLTSPQYGHPAHVEPASGYGPCRACLKQFRVGADDRILFTYNPFAGLDGYPSPGPIFIHASSCEPFSEADKFPDELRGLPLTLEAFGDDRWILGRERPRPEAIEAAIQKCFAIPGVRYIHVRNTEAGCFMARIERSQEEHSHSR